MVDENSTSSESANLAAAKADDSLFKRLCEGFAYLRKRRDFGEEEAGDLPSIDKENSCALVNFIDPTSAPGSVLPSSPGAKPPLEFYEKLITVFEKEFDLTLKQVSYQHFRSGASGTIETLPVRPVLTKSHGGLVSISGDTGTAAWGDTADGDPTSWHRTPYCHVYIAACESLEHYRNKVKPSVRALVSQIEAVTGSPQKSDNVSDGSSGNASGAHYLIIYVPTGEKASSDDQHRATSRVGAAFASRVAAARQRMSANRDMPTDSAHSGGASAESSEVDQDGSEHGTERQVSATNHLSKVEREIARRFAADFPGGHVCTISTLNEQSEITESENSDDKLLRKLEWTSFTKALGNAITDGFGDRCRRYDDELRRLDAQRATDRKSNGDAQSTENVFNLNYFFLVKESLALTYEQMHLPSEALLQYNELRAFIPDNLSDSCMHVQGGDDCYDDLSHGSSQESSSLAKLALNGDIDGFRSQLRAMAGLTPDSDILEQYLFYRETLLLFKIGDPIEIVRKCFAFAQSMFAIKQRVIDLSNEEGSRKLSIEAERWAFDFSWDVKKASNRFLVVDLTESPMKTDAERRQGTAVGEFARHLCDLLEFARLRLLKLGDLLLPEGNALKFITQAEATVPRTAWTPWEPPSSEKEPPLPTGAKIKLDPQAHFLDGAFSSQSSFQYRYLEVLNACVTLNRFSGRQRTAARLQIEAVEMYIRKGDKEKAIKALRSISDVYGKDRWTACYFFMLFRLAGFQRQIGNPSEYLKTLIYAFNEKTAAGSPSDALKVLQNDLELVVEKHSTPDTRFNAVPLFDPTLGLEGRTAPSGAGLVKKLFVVGETASITLSLRSYLPADIQVDSVTVELIPFRVYVAAMEDSIPIKKDDVHKVLSLPPPTSISSGDNNYSFKWVPLSPGQFVVAAIAVQWKGIRFDYFMPELRRPTIRINVVPSEATQSMKVQPAFLVPGHQQPLSVIFSAGSDIVDTAVLQFVCSPGLHLLPPGEGHESDKWATSCDVEVPHCPPGESVVLRALLRCDEAGAAEGSAQSVHVKIASSYRDAKADAAEADSEDSCMDTVMEAVVPTLGKAPLCVEGADLVPYSENKRMINISLLCCSLATFTIKSWGLDLPSYLTLANGGDMNESLVNLRTVSGDRLSFGFDCNVESKADVSFCQKATFSVELEDEYGTSFKEKLGLEFKTSSVPNVSIPHIGSVSIEIRPSALTSFVGLPITLVYVVDTSIFSQIQERVSYQVDTHGADWIVSGKAEGIVDCSGSPPLQLDFVAIPARPGFIDFYPALHLALGDEHDSQMVLPATVADTKSFYALSPSSHTTIAFPMPSVKSQRASI